MGSGETFDLPNGSWTDDSSWMLTALYNIRELDRSDFDDIMEKFIS